MIKICVDSPINESEIFDNMIEIRGWAISDQPIKKLKLYLNGKCLQSIPYGFERLDVYRAFPDVPNSAKSGFNCKLEFDSDMGENVTFSVEVVSGGREDNTAQTLQQNVKVSYYPTNPSHKSPSDGEQNIDPAEKLRFLNNYLRKIEKKLQPLKESLPEQHVFIAKQRCSHGIININGLYFPDITGDPGYCREFESIYEDSLLIYDQFNNNYSYRIVDIIDKYLGEGVYCYIGPNGERIMVEPDDVVIDVGAWIGDFSAYAAKCGAFVYAFEPDEKNLKWLRQTAELNGNIEVVPCGLGNENKELSFMGSEVGGGSSQILEGSSSKIRTITLDSWAEQQKIKRIDFIKSDIEGYERYLLMGAKESLKRWKPTLSICTYHLPDDFQVLSKIILETVPEYRIIKRKCKLFAYVPNRKARRRRWLETLHR